MAHLMRACLIVAAVIAATFLPFVAGGYDPMAGPLSGMAWALGRVGLVLVPIGGLWLWASTYCVDGAWPPRWLRRVTIGACGFIALVMVVMAFACSGPVLTVSTAAIAGLFLFRLARRLRSAESGRATFRAAAVSMIVAPIVVFAAQSALVDPVANAARNRVIANGAPLIAEIERYRDRRGAYPASLFSIWGDYKPSIVGVERYYYEPSGDAYNVIFREPSLGFGTKRFVVYNPRGKQRVTVHEQDRLLLDEAGLDADNAGYTIVQPLPQPHWKAFLFLS
jgi:hypothetical protein